MRKDQEKSPEKLEAEEAVNQKLRRQLAIDMMSMMFPGASVEAWGGALFYLIKANQGEAEQRRKEKRDNAGNITR